MSARTPGRPAVSRLASRALQGVASATVVGCAVAVAPAAHAAPTTTTRPAATTTATTTSTPIVRHTLRTLERRARAGAGSRATVTSSRTQDRPAIVPTTAVTAPATPAPATPAPTTPAPTTTPVVAPATVTPATYSADAVIALAKQLSGIWYVYGGTTPAGFDCSGLTQYIHTQLGVSLPRTAEAQRKALRPVTEPQVGDLVFFGVPAFHVGIYAGDGMMYDSPRSGKQSGLHKIWSTNVTYGRP